MCFLVSLGHSFIILNELFDPLFAVAKRIKNKISFLSAKLIKLEY